MPITFPKFEELGLSHEAKIMSRNFGGKPLAEFLNQDDFETTGVKIPKAKYFKPGILETDYRQNGIDLADVNFSKPLLARACLMADDATGHPGDFGPGTAIDILPTVHIESKEDFFEYLDDLTAICKKGEVDEEPGAIRPYLHNGNVRNYYQYEGGDPDRLINNIGVLVAEKSGDYMGAMIEHPGEEGVYIFESSRQGKGATYHRIFKDTGDDIKQISGVQTLGFENRMFQSLIQAYKKVREANLIPSNRSFHMEFSFDSERGKVYANQIKLFREKYALTPDFILEKQDYANRSSQNQATTNDYAAFGLTPKEGIEIDLYPVNGLFPEDIKFANVDGDVAYAYSDIGFAGSTHERPHLNFMPTGEMKAGLFHNTSSGCIAHGGHWLIANSDIGVWQNDLPARAGDCSSDKSTKIRIKSDGIRARVERISHGS